MHRRNLAQSSHAGVDVCGCGTVHLTVGALTVRLHPDAYEALCETVVQGLVALKLEREQQSWSQARVAPRGLS